MTLAPRVLLVNPAMISAANARFPLAVLNLSAALEGMYAPVIIDGNVDPDFVANSVRAAGDAGVAAVGITVMGGPQLVSAIAVSKAIRERHPAVPIVWGGGFPTVCPDAAVNVPYVDYAVRGQGEQTFVELLDALTGGRDMASVAGLTWRSDGAVLHNPERKFSTASFARRLPYESLERPEQYLVHTFLGRRTIGYQAALGCRFRCTFCGVATMFRGKTALLPAERLEQDLQFMRDRFGVDSIQFYDHNFFDREVDMLPLLEVLAKFRMPWWCYARADALVNMSERSWALVRKSGLRMAYIGAESPTDSLLHDIRKGTNANQTLQAIEICRRHGVIPELSFMVAPPRDPEGETEKTFDFIRMIKRVDPASEVMIYIYTPLPRRWDDKKSAAMASELRDCEGNPVVFPATADAWAESKWVRYWCHEDAPWVSPELRRRIHDFSVVLACRYPTAIDVRAPAWGKSALRLLSAWRYRFRRYENPWELRASRKFIRQWDPKVMSL
jgi:anaerobic magnesium-protoporphyrin IX monomethyl ester cyclase